MTTHRRTPRVRPGGMWQVRVVWAQPPGQLAPSLVSPTKNMATREGTLTPRLSQPPAMWPPRFCHESICFGPALMEIQCPVISITETLCGVPPRAQHPPYICQVQPSLFPRALLLWPEPRGS